MNKPTKIKVLHIGSGVGETSGVTTVINSIISNLPLESFDTNVLFFENANVNNIIKIKSMGHKVYLSPRPANLLTYIKFINKLFKLNKYDIIHCHLTPISGIVFFIAQKHGINVRILHSHSSKLSSSLIKTVIHKLILKALPPKFTHAIACSKQAGYCLFGSKKFYVIPNAIDTAKFKYNPTARKKLREELNISDKTMVIGHIGGIRKEKNHTFMIEILKEILKKEKNIKLIFVGEGSSKKINKLKKIAKFFDVDKNILFLGHKDDTSVYYSLFDIFLFPSLNEGLPLALLEAQSSGLPVLASTEITKEARISSSLFYSLPLTASAYAWSNKILSINKLKIRIAENNFKTNETSSIRFFVKKIINFYEKTLTRVR